MPRPLLTIWLSLIWLLASPSLHWPGQAWLEVGAPNAAAEPAKAQPIKMAQSIMVDEPKAQPKKAVTKKPVKKTATKKRVGSSGIVVSTQPGFHPMRTITPPEAPVATGTIVTPARDPRYPNVPTVPAIIPETSQDRVARCTHQGNLGGLSAGEQGAYVHNCAF